MKHLKWHKLLPFLVNINSFITGASSHTYLTRVMGSRPMRVFNRMRVILMDKYLVWTRILISKRSNRKNVYHREYTSMSSWISFNICEKSIDNIFKRRITSSGVRSLTSVFGQYERKFVMLIGKLDWSKLNSVGKSDSIPYSPLVTKFLRQMKQFQLNLLLYSSLYLLWACIHLEIFLNSNRTNTLFQSISSFQVFCYQNLIRLESLIRVVWCIGKDIWCSGWSARLLERLCRSNTYSRKPL